MWITLIFFFIMIVYAHHRISQVEEQIKEEKSRLKSQTDKVINIIKEVKKETDEIAFQMKAHTDEFSSHFDDIEDQFNELSFTIDDIEQKISTSGKTIQQSNKSQKFTPSTYQVSQAYADDLYEKIRYFKASNDNELDVLEDIFSSFSTLHLKEGYILDVKINEGSGRNNIPYIRNQKTKRAFNFTESFDLIETDGSKYSWFELALCFFIVNKCFFRTWHNGAYDDLPAITKRQWEKLANFTKYTDDERKSIAAYKKFNTIQIKEDGVIMVNMLTYSNSLDVNDTTFTIYPNHKIEYETKNLIHSIQVLF